MKSDNVKSGMQQAPHRSLFNALGFTEEEMKKPMVGIVSSYNVTFLLSLINHQLTLSANLYIHDPFNKIKLAFLTKICHQHI